MNTVYYHDITHDDMLNGDGLRTVLWLSGCTHRCKGCQNPITWDPESGIILSEDAEEEFWSWLDKDYTQGATFSGGDPLHPNNRDKVGSLIREIRNRYGDAKDIWLYTGYSLFNEAGEWVLKDQNNNSLFLDWLPLIDVLVDGRFEESVRKMDICENKQVHWCGSSNQRVIDMKRTIAHPMGKIVPHQ